jgi:hypothetical protein
VAEELQPAKGVESLSSARRSLAGLISHTLALGNGALDGRHNSSSSSAGSDPIDEDLKRANKF